MSFKSEAQRRKFAKLVQKGLVEQTVFDTWDKASEGKALPARVAKPKKKETTKPTKVWTAKVVK